LAVASSLCVSAATAWVSQVSGVRSLEDAIERTAVLCAAFIVGNVRGSEVFGSFARPEFWPTAYLAVFLGYIAYVLGDVMIGCWHYAGSAGGALEVGLRFIAAGCVAGIMYSAFKLAALALVHLGPGMPTVLEFTIGRTAVVLAGVLVVWGYRSRRWFDAGRSSAGGVAATPLMIGCIRCGRH
jgi:hypothetical protein